MHLLARNSKIAFYEISEVDISSYPEYLQKVMVFIKEWQEGRQTFLINTSGSTGEPKEFILRRELMIKSAELTAKTFGLAKGDTLFCCLDMSYIAGLMMAVRALVLECDLYVEEAVGNPLKKANALERQSPHFDFASFIPLQIEKILAETPENISVLNGMKAILIGGGPVSEKQLELIRKIKAPVYQTYSMTETYTHIAIRHLNNNEAGRFNEGGTREIPAPEEYVYYRPLEGVKISQDSRGCLVVSSPITEGRELVTNDIINLHIDGSFEWLGRFDNIINTGGIKVPAEKIENAARKVLHTLDIDDVECMAAGLADDTLGQKIVLLLESPAKGDALKLSIRAELKKLLSKYEMPKEIIFIERFQRTATRKVQRGDTLKALGI